MPIEWAIFVDEDQTPHMVVRDKPNAPLRPATTEECGRACKLLNEEGSNIVRLICYTPDCKDKGGWIERTRDDVKRSVYTCDSCGRPMQI